MGAQTRAHECFVAGAATDQGIRYRGGAVSRAADDEELIVQVHKPPQLLVELAQVSAPDNFPRPCLCVVHGGRVPAAHALLLNVSACWSGRRVQDEMGARRKEVHPHKGLCFGTLRFGRADAPTDSRATQFGSETAGRSAVSARLLAHLVKRLRHTSKLHVSLIKLSLTDCCLQSLIAI